MVGPKFKVGQMVRMKSNNKYYPHSYGSGVIVAPGFELSSGIGYYYRVDFGPTPEQDMPCVNGKYNGKYRCDGVWPSVEEGALERA